MSDITTWQWLRSHIPANCFYGPTSWEGYIGPLWWRLPYWKYLKIGIAPMIGWNHDTDR